MKRGHYCFGATVWFLIYLPTETAVTTSRRHLLDELKQGVVFLIKSDYLRPIVFTAFIFNIAWYLLLAVFSYYAINHLSFTASAVGAALSVFGVGMVTGAFLYKPIAAKLSFGKQLLLGPISAFTAALLMAATILFPYKFIVFVAFFLFGFGPVIWTIATTALRQVVTPTAMIARVSSVIMTITFGARPLGAMLGVWLSANYGLLSCLIAVLIGFFVQLSIIAFSTPTRLKTLDQPSD